MAYQPFPRSNRQVVLASVRHAANERETAHILHKPRADPAAEYRPSDAEERHI